MFYRIRDHKRWREFLALLKSLRARWPTGRLYVIADNFSPHRRAEVLSSCAAREVELVFLPTHASWLNWIEAEFAALRYSHSTAPTTAATTNKTPHGAYIRWRNQHARPKRNFAPNSKIRHPDYPIKAA